MKQHRKIITNILWVLSICLVLVGCDSNFQSGGLLRKTATSFSPKHVHQLQNESIINFAFTPSGHPYIDVWINDSGPYQFILDTGSNVSFVSQDVAKRLGLPETSYKVRINPDSNAPPHNAPSYRVDELKIEGVEFREMRLAALPYEQFKQVSNTTGTKIDGLLGFNTFADFLFTIDFPARQLLLQHGQLAKLGNPNVIRMDASLGRPVVYGTFGLEDNFHQYPFLIDTGAPFGVQMPPNISSIPYSVLADYKQELSHVHGRIQFKARKLETTFMLGYLQIRQPTVLFYDQGVYPHTKYGSIGMDVLRNLVITFDQKNSFVVLHPKVRRG